MGNGIGRCQIDKGWRVIIADLKPEHAEEVATALGGASVATPITLNVNDFAQAKAAIDKAEEKVILLENTRFHAEEEANDPGFAKQLAELGGGHDVGSLQEGGQKHHQLALGADEFELIRPVLHRAQHLEATSR